VARETAERAREAFACEVEEARSALEKEAEEAEDRGEYERYRAEAAQARADSESAHARLAARLAEINVARDRAMAEGMRAFDREATRDRLQRDAQHVWGSGAKLMNAPPKVFNLVGMSSESVRVVAGSVSQAVTSVEEQVSLNMWANCVSE
jgi:membrane protein involved in colicin uptake